MKHVRSAGGIVLSPDHLVAVVTNTIGSRTFPKGSVEEGEEPHDAAPREIHEETGIPPSRLVVVRELGVLVRPGFTKENPTTPPVLKHIHMFLCTTDVRELAPIAPDVSRADWVEPSVVAEVLTHSAEADFFRQLGDLSVQLQPDPEVL